MCFCMGLPNDKQRHGVWADTYSAEFSRDLEPSKEGGARVWDVLASCVQLYKKRQDCTDAPDSPCCTTHDKEVFANVWSLVKTDGSDRLLTSVVTERHSLVSSGQWREECSPVAGPTVFCYNKSILDGRPGPFMVYSEPTVIQQPHTGIGTRPLYRCAASNRHFLSVD